MSLMSLSSFSHHQPLAIGHQPSAIGHKRLPQEDKKRPRLTVGGGEREVGRRMPAGAKIGFSGDAFLNKTNLLYIQNKSFQEKWAIFLSCRFNCDGQTILFMVLWGILQYFWGTRRKKENRLFFASRVSRLMSKNARETRGVRRKRVSPTARRLWNLLSAGGTHRGTIATV